MTTIPPTITSPVAPWQTKDISSGARIAMSFAVILLLIVLIVSFLIAFAMINILLGVGSSPDSPTTTLIAAFISGGVFLASLTGLILLWPRTRRIDRFTPTYGALAPTTVAHPFEVRFQRYLWGRSMRGKGEVQFTPEGLQISGTMEPHALFQFGVVLAVTILPLIFFNFGLGILPALLIGYYIGRKKVNQAIPYSALSNLQVQGRRVTLHNHQTPKQISFAVADDDGERLYRELLPRFPAALGGWQG